MDRLRKWVESIVKRPSTGTPQQARVAAQGKREARASHITDVQAQVRATQQEITDLSAVVERDGLQTDRDRLVKLSQQLSEQQRELARFQGRI